MVIAAALPLASCLAQRPVDPLTGHWELNVGRSHYGGGAEPRTRETFVCTASGRATSCTTTSERPDGRTVVAGFTAKYDGNPAPVTGIADMDEVRLTRVSATIADATFSLHGKAAFAYRAVRSADGLTLTISSVDPATRAALKSIIVYDAR